MELCLELNGNLHELLLKGLFLLLARFEVPSLFGEGHQSVGRGRNFIGSPQEFVLL